MSNLAAPTTHEGTDAEPRIHLLDTLLANMEGMIYRCRIDAQWTMEYVSAGCFELTGYQPQDFLLNSRICLEELTHAEDRAYCRKVIVDALANHTRYVLEYRIIKANGEVRWVGERGMAVTDPASGDTVLEGFIQDINERKRAFEALREAERRFRSIFENAVEGIFQSTATNGYIAVNPALARMYGYESPQHLMAELRDIDHQVYVDPGRRHEFLRRMEEDGVVLGFESRVWRRDGSIIWISENARAVLNDAGEVLFFEGTVEEITTRKQHEEEIRFQATHDALTGLPNRTLLYDRLEQAVFQAHRHGNYLAVVFFDLDQFKYVNDSLGHQVGDRLLKTVASRLKSCVRDADTVARLGGDEFVLLLTDQASEDSFTQTLQPILEKVATPWLVNGVELQITCSMGVSLCPADAADADTLLKHADAAMFRAKQTGRNNFQFFSAEMNSAINGRLEMMTKLRRALGANEFTLHYQPKLQLATGKIIGAEALIRWPQADGSMISPAQFIPVAEESGLIIPLGEWVLQTACAQIRAWEKAGHAAIPVSVNISPLQLERGNVVDMVTRTLAETGLAPQYLELEITESVVMREVEKSFAILEQLKALGVKISIDDFGTGYSSLSYLRRFPVNTLKIDQSFVRNISSDPNNAGIIQAIISLGHTLNLNVLAEGVETEEEFRFLLENRCDEMQGYYLSKPVDEEAFVQLLPPSDA
ncbi:PAS domain S-box-containing protein/diguanylate cyclase (GGDEF)-like protein [Paucimonas lemoignei]|uniref:PAS domain S-box-containing protein/diguanylate cyclase (GGDEF)-like protein n=1 Tax=Paucimonas lemoignei TaxID=29443 RepID=A0A4R3I0L1_PAULE|nr:bifunctional diguanylate cyclase/phosphodiesterase [Paucimonas lemoignei]TCS39068.1 PAS domain S-box-containing protein/diguanylate cyclase (GGDEF)-like protein [Paucimonas lemoignei]